MENNNKRSSVILLVYLSLSIVAPDPGDKFCPCGFYINQKGSKVADCKERNLTTIPICVPKSIQVLDLGLNNLRYIPEQFQRFGNLRALLLAGNKKFAAHTDSFEFLFNLEILELSYTDLSYLNGETFQHLSKLRRLDLWGPIGQLNVSKELFSYLGSLQTLKLGMKLRTIALPNGLFNALPLLLELDISYCTALTFYNYTFAGLSHLMILNLHDPMITINLPVGVFKPLIGLKELRLEGLCGVWDPSFDCKTIDKRVQYLPSLQTLYIDKRLISHLGVGFSVLKNLKELYLANTLFEQACEIEEINSETFINLHNSLLEKLVVENCIIHRIRPEWLTHLTGLREISMSASSMLYMVFWSNFSIGLEHSSITRVRLSLTSNNVKTRGVPFPFTVYDGLNTTRLTYLEVTDAKFNCVSDSSITNLPKSLQYLNLTRNYLHCFGFEGLKYLENLEILDLSNQDYLPVKPLREKPFDTLDYSYQNVLKLKAFSASLWKEDFKSSRLNKLDMLEDNMQTCINVTRTCHSLPYVLNTLDVSKSSFLCNMIPLFCDSNNSLRILKAAVQRDRSCFESRSFWSVLKNLAKLEHLNLNGNLIDSIPHDAFSGLYNLKELSLNNNKLLELSFEAKDLISLRTLDLSVNSIAYASISFTNQIEDLFERTNLTLFLDANPLVCKCKQLHFVSWLAVTQVISTKTKLNCTFENGTRISLGRISHIRDLKYKCTKLDTTIGCTVTFCGLTFILIGLVQIWHNRQKLRYLVSFGRRTLNPYHPIEDNEIQMEYDVYISLDGDFNVTQNMTLRDLAIYKILPGLEQRGVRVMIREELDAGRNLYEIITQTVRRSKKVLALLTNGYCSDMWNVFEFNQAVMEGIYTNRQVAIPVLFESLRRENVKEEICEFLQMEPVHRYSPDLSDRAFIDFLYERIRDTREFG